MEVARSLPHCFDVFVGVSDVCGGAKLPFSVL